MSDKPARENQIQHLAFLIYSQMPELSVQKLHQTWEKHVPKTKKPALRTLKEWCRKYQWVARAEAIHQAAKEEAVKRTVEQLTMSKTEILVITRAVMIRYGHMLKDDAQGKLTMLDFEKAWKIQRIELGLATEIGRHEVDIKDRYEGVSDEDLIEKIEYLTAKYKQSLIPRKLGIKQSLLLRNQERLNMS